MADTARAELLQASRAHIEQAKDARSESLKRETQSKVSSSLAGRGDHVGEGSAQAFRNSEGSAGLEDSAALQHLPLCKAVTSCPSTPQCSFQEHARMCPSISNGPCAWLVPTIHVAGVAG